MKVSERSKDCWTCHKSSDVRRWQVVRNLRNNIAKTESMCPTLHVVPTEEIQVLTKLHKL